MTDRTEEAGIAGLLHLTVGGKPVEMRVLSIEESDAWQRALGVAVSNLDVPEDAEDGGVMLGKMLVAGAAAKLDLILAYDLDAALGTRESVRKRMTKGELSAAFEMILDAENPKEEAANRSVVEAFGRPGLMVQVGLNLVQAAARSVLVSSMSGRLPSGVSIPEPSALDSPTNSSSSSGPTVNGASSVKPKRRRAAPSSPSPTATPT